jgi:polysaccharide pyruvyl transferase WcaK-like protein
VRVLVVGPYGGLNLGDDLIAEVVVGSLQAAGHEVTVTSARPELTAERLAVAAVPALNPRRLQFGALREVRQADVVVFGGGQQIHEARFGNPFWGLLTTCALFIREARRQGKSTFFWGVGVEPMRTPIGPWMARRWIAKVTAATARDRPSLDRLIEYGVPRERAQLTADPVFALPRKPREQSREFLASLLDEPVDGPLILLTPAQTRIHGTDYLGAIVEGCKQVASSRGGRVLVHITDRQVRYDLTLLERPELQQDQWLSWLPLDPYSADELLQMHGGADVLVSARMHPLILAMTQGTRWVAIPINEKIQTLTNRFGSLTKLATAPVGLDAADVAETVASRLDMPLDSWLKATGPVLDELQTEAAVTPTAFRKLIATS